MFGTKHPALDSESYDGHMSGIVKQRLCGTWNSGDERSGARMSVTLNRTGHLVTSFALDITADRNADGFCPRADQLIDSVDLEIGGQKIQSVPGSWLRVYDELYRTDEERKGYAKLSRFDVFDKGTTKRLHLPIPFFFSDDDPLPLVDLEFHEVRMYIRFARAKDMAAAGFDVTRLACWPLEASANYVHLSDAALAVPRPEEYDVEHVQFTGSEPWSVEAGDASATRRFRLLFEHPIELVAWTVSDEAGNPVEIGEAHIEIDGIPLTYRHDAGYYNGQHPWEHFGTTLSRGTYVHRFGSEINFWKVNDAELVLSGFGSAKASGKVDIFAVSTKKMMIAGGMMLDLTLARTRAQAGLPVLP